MGADEGRIIVLPGNEVKSAKRRIMTLVLEIPPERSAALQAQAHARGLSVEEWPLELAEEQELESATHLQTTDPTEWARQFHEWAESHDRTTPLLSDEAVSRDGIYRDSA
jgi:hypothetical protein